MFWLFNVKPPCSHEKGYILGHLLSTSKKYYNSKLKMLVSNKVQNINHTVLLEIFHLTALSLESI